MEVYRKPSVPTYEKALAEALHYAEVTRTLLTPNGKQLADGARDYAMRLADFWLNVAMEIRLRDEVDPELYKAAIQDLASGSFS